MLVNLAESEIWSFRTTSEIKSIRDRQTIIPEIYFNRNVIETVFIRCFLFSYKQSRNSKTNSLKRNWYNENVLFWNTKYKELHAPADVRFLYYHPLQTVLPKSLEVVQIELRRVNCMHDSCIFERQMQILDSPISHLFFGWCFQLNTELAGCLLLRWASLINTFKVLSYTNHVEVTIDSIYMSW